MFDSGLRTGNSRILALGFFDGVHIGHQALIKIARQMADKMGSVCAVLTFDSHPDLLTKGSAPQLLVTLEKRRELLLQFGAQEVIFEHFDEQFMNLPWREFATDILFKKYSAAGIVAGYDFTFGYKGEGTPTGLFEICKEAGIPCEIVERTCVDGTTASSSAVRGYLAKGDVEGANRMLGFEYSLDGIVSPGRGLASRLGFPTVNFTPQKGLALPKFGVYKARAIIEGSEYPAALNIGIRPTVGTGEAVCEAHIIGASGNFYNLPISVYPERFLRAEKKFASIEELKAQVEKDIEECSK